MSNNNKKIALPIAINDLQETITNAVNNSHLPASVMDPIIANVYNQVHLRAREEYAVCKRKEEEDASNNNDADTAEPDNPQEPEESVD